MQEYVWLHYINLSRCIAWSQVWRHRQNSETLVVPQAKGQEEGIEPGKKEGHPQGTSLDKALSPYQAPGPLSIPQL